MSLLLFIDESTACQREVNRPAALFGVTLLGVIGSIVFLLLPMLIGGFTEHLQLGTRQVGLLGSADMLGMFIAAIGATAWVRSCNWRLIAALACGLLAICHVASGITQAFAPLFAIRLAAGFAGGSLMSIALTSLGDSRHPDRYFALFVAAQLTLGGIGLWLFPGMLERFGLAGIFAGLAVVVLAAALLIPFIPQQGRRIRPSVSPAMGENTRSRSLGPGVMALVACFIFNLGIMAVWAYLERMGHAASLPAGFIGRTLALSLAAALFGALMAAAVEDRFGRVLPLMVNLAVQVAALLLLAADLSRTTYTLGVMLIAFGWNFPVAYQLAITVTMDASGRLVVLFLSAVKLGYAAAPLIAAQLLLLDLGFAPVLALAALSFVASALMFIALARQKPRRQGSS